MHLLPRETEKLLLHLAGELAKKATRSTTNIIKSLLE